MIQIVINLFDVATTVIAASACSYRDASLRQEAARNSRLLFLLRKDKPG